MKSYLIALLLSLAVAESYAASVAGRISFVSRRGQKPAVAETVIWLEPLDASKPVRASAASYQMMTRSKTLLPHVLPIPVGSTVSFPNDDPIAHNLFSLSAGNSFDLGFYRKGAGKSQKFDRPGVVNVYCNVHPNMSAVLYVIASPFYTTATEEGGFTINDVPRGKYRLLASHEIGGSAWSDIEVAADGKVIGGAALVLDVRRYRAQPHMNKYGKPYDPLKSNREY